MEIDDDENANHECETCAEYWQRMIDEGLWDNERKQWTAKGWANIERVISDRHQRLRVADDSVDNN